jgi:hypothetical protein
MRIQKLAIRVHWILSEQLGLDLLKFLRTCRGILPFTLDFIKFRRSYKGPISIAPCFGDRFANAGADNSEYFWQDLIAAREIAEQKPVRHIDVGSRLDGFVAHVASFRHIEVFDIRPISADIPGVTFIQADIMSEQAVNSHTSLRGCCDSISCLHALEHFGLGRYGDTVTPMGYHLGLKNISTLLQPGGICYLSLPVGVQRVEFNANWVFTPENIIDKALSEGLIFKRLIIIAPSGVLHDVSNEQAALKLNLQEDRLGLFVFRKT